jgi:hypothetical protein
MDELNCIRIEQNVNFSDIESLGKQIIAEKPDKIQMPNSLSNSGGLGIEGAVLQLLGTWLRNTEKHILQTEIKDQSPDSFTALCNSFLGLCALRLSNSILIAEDEKVELSTALQPAIPIFTELRAERFEQAFAGKYFTIPALKSLVIKGGKDREFDNPLYNNNLVVGAQKFNQLTLKALAAIEPRSSEIDPTVVSHLSEILRELFTNTHRHARTDFNGNPLSKNFRGVIFNSLNLDVKRLDEISKSGGGVLAKFIGQWKPANNKLFRAIDITVVDSGPGYARRWHKLDKNELTIEQEKEAIIECFTKHKSTDIADSSGSGLSNVLSDLKVLKGWFRLRTGRALVEKSFYNQEGTTIIETKDIKVRDSFMEGVVFNVVIPLESLLVGEG